MITAFKEGFRSLFRNAPGSAVRKTAERLPLNVDAEIE